MTRPYAEVIGDPIAQSKSPLIHNFWLEKLGIDAEYRACHVRADELADYFIVRRADPLWLGCNATLPHKTAVIGYADELDASVDEVGAANCIARSAGNLMAYNTDVAGVDAAIRWVGSPTCLIGAGGAARATIPTLDVFVACYPLHVISRNPAKAAISLNAEGREIKLFDFDHAADALRGATGVINASPLGMTGQAAMPRSVLDGLGLIEPKASVFDMVYAPLETDLLKEARKLGRETVDGLVMLVGQAKVAFMHFYGVRPPDQFDAELRALLIQ